MTKKSAGIRHPRRPFFRRSWLRSAEFVLLKPLNQGSDKKPLPVGTVIKAEDYRAASIISMYRRFRIGLAGHPWTEAYLNARVIQKPKQRKESRSPAKKEQTEAARELRKASAELFDTNARTGIDKTLDQLKAKFDAELPE